MAKPKPIWWKLSATPTWHTRRFRDQTLVVLTEPSQWALCIEVDGSVRVRSLMGVSSPNPLIRLEITDAQRERLVALGYSDE